MVGSYLKTSARNLLRNKLFTAINVVGLAISMSVGLLLIAFVLDLRSYDKFHKNRERIYRITNVATVKGEQGSQSRPGGKYSSTSIKAGKLIREKVSGISEVAIMRNDFSQDAKVGDNTLPTKGFWADPSLFRIFTFPMLEDDPETALKDPYSIVLTETAAKKLFGNQSALGKAININTLDYQVTGIMKDVPFFSHINFEALVSLSTAEQLNRNNNDFDNWTSMSSNYMYLLLPPTADITSIQSQLDAIAREENRAEENTKIQLELLPLYDIVVGESLSRSEGGLAPLALTYLRLCFGYSVGLHSLCYYRRVSTIPICRWHEPCAVLRK